MILRAGQVERVGGFGGSGRHVEILEVPLMDKRLSTRLTHDENSDEAQRPDDVSREDSEEGAADIVRNLGGAAGSAAAGGVSCYVQVGEEPAAYDCGYGEGTPSQRFSSSVIRSGCLVAPATFRRRRSSGVMLPLAT